MVLFTIAPLVASKETLKLNVGEKAQLTATVLPAEATVKTLTWDWDDDGTVEVRQMNAITIEITAKAAGTVAVIAITDGQE